MATDVAAQIVAEAALPPASASSPSVSSATADSYAVAQIGALKKRLEELLALTPVDYDALLPTLRELQGAGAVITAHVLAATQVGHLVNKLTRSTSASPSDAAAATVRDTAKAVIAQWKDKVKAQAPATPPSAPSAASTSLPTPSLRPSPALPAASPFPPPLPPPAPPGSLKRKPDGPPPATKTSAPAPKAVVSAEPRAFASEAKKLKSAPSAVSASGAASSSPSSSPPQTPSPTSASSTPSTSYALGRTGDAVRSKIQRLLFDALGGSAGEWETELAVRMEAAMHAAFPDTGAAYKNKYRELAMNLKDPHNPDLNDALLCGAWSPEQVVSMSVKDLASQSLKAQREAEAKWARDEARSDLGKLNGLTDMFRCGKCRERKCTYYQMQTRSADEPMTVFVRCTVCGNRWKM